MPSSEKTNTLIQDRTHARSRAMAEAVADAFSQILKEEVNKHGGFIGLRHLADLDKVFHAKVEELSNVFEKALHEAHREHEDIKWHAIKRPAFDRLMVKNFESLFFHTDKNGLPHGCISRRVLPGFFLALSMMLGPEAIKTYQHRCDKAMERVMKGGLPVNWDMVAQDEDVHNVVLDAQFTIAKYFDNPNQRADWFINIINANLVPAENHGADAHWELERPALFEMVHCLLMDLKQAVHDDVAWTRLALHHDDADRDALQNILENL